MDLWLEVHFLPPLKDRGDLADRASLISMVIEGLRRAKRHKRKETVALRQSKNAPLP